MRRTASLAAILSCAGLTACGNLKSEEPDRRLFAERRAEFEALAAILRSCPGPAVIYPGDPASTGEPAHCGGVPMTEIAERVEQLGLERASVFRRGRAAYLVHFVTGSTGVMITESETGIAWSDDYANIGPEEYKPLTRPPGVWWRFHW